MNSETYTSYSTTPIDSDARRIRRLKRLVVSVMVIFLIVVIGLTLYHNLTVGQVVITTNNSQNTISLKQSSADSNKLFAPVILHNSKAATVAPGTYIVSVQGNGTAASQTIHVMARKTARYTINLNSLGSIETVADINAQAFVVDGSRLLYVDQSNKNLYQLDNQNNLTLLNNSVALNVVQWVAPSFGIGQDIGQDIDQGGNLYSIENGNVQQFAAPVSGNKIQPFSLYSQRRKYLCRHSRLRLQENLHSR